MDQASKDALPKANLTHLYELMDFHIAIHEFMKQMYMLEVNLEDEEMVFELKIKEHEMDSILMQVQSRIQELSKPTRNNRNAFIPYICSLQVLEQSEIDLFKAW